MYLGFSSDYNIYCKSFISAINRKAHARFTHYPTELQPFVLSLSCPLVHPCNKGWNTRFVLSRFY